MAARAAGATVGARSTRTGEFALLEWVSISIPILNASSAILLVSAFVAIRRGKRERHRNLMLANLGVSILFLVCYVVQISTVGHKSFPGDDWVRVVFLIILTTHTLLAVCLVPLALRTFFLAFRERFSEHRRIARVTFPVWLYVSVTGVVIYWMVNHLRPYS
jgi:putative membrane protein